MSWFKRIMDAPALGEVARGVGSGGTAALGVQGSSTVLVSAGMVRHLEQPLVLVVAHLDDADEAADELTALGLEAAKFPAMEIVPGETSVNLELLSERLTLVRRLRDGRCPQVVVAPMAALMQTVPRADRLEKMHRVIRAGETVDAEAFATWLHDAGYARVPTIENPGEFAIRGGIIDVFPPGGTPARIDLFGNEVDGLFEIDLGTMGSDRRLDALEIIGASLEDLHADTDGLVLAELLPEGTVAVLSEVAELTEQGRSYLERVSDARCIVTTTAVMKSLGERCVVVEVNGLTAGSAEGCVTLPVRPLPSFSESTPEAIGELAELAATHDTVVLCQNEGETQRMGELLAEHAPKTALDVRTHYLHRGLIWDAGDDHRPLALVPYHELLHRYHTRRRVGRLAAGRAMDAFLDLHPGDYVVHRDHGIAKFTGLQTLDQGGTGQAEEFLTLEFSGGSKLHVPATRIELVQRYVGAHKGTPELSTLGGRKWTNQKKKVQEAVLDLAEEMLRLQASRESMPGIRYPADTAWQREFEAEFPYDETEDQLTAAAAVKRDMTHERPMDRLLCGDVGFGKTEIAIRAAFKAAEFGKQVAVLVPTTWLAEQHERTLRDRFADYPFRIESLSRFKTGKQQNQIIEAVKKGQVDILVGTHRILSQDVTFADLGLVVIDEEQRFGVEHKHRLLSLRATADVLTMTATPIPRTLHMAMLGLRDISSLATAPHDRRSVVTEVLSYDEHRIQSGIMRELAREGQVFFVHNRIFDIYDVADRVQAMAPDAKVIVGHGQMPTRELERVMRTFVRGDADILVSTTIIESGVDIPTANTMFIHDAHMFGLSELHQLRGRVGRHKHRAYCYLLLDPNRVVSNEAMKRLRALESFTMLGAGFKIALRDLEIRGAGNLLGAEQSGHIAAVGYEMYCQLLEQAVSGLKHEKRVVAVDTTLELGVNGTIPKGFIPSDTRRMDAYRRVSQSNTHDELEQIRHDLVSAYGELPTSAEHLIDLAEIRIAAAALDIRTITWRDNDLVFRTRRPGKLQSVFEGIAGPVRLVGQPDNAGLSEVYWRPPDSYREAGSLLAVLRKRLRHEGTEARRHEVVGTE